MLIEIDHDFMVDSSQIVSIQRSGKNHDLAVVVLVGGRVVNSIVRYDVLRAVSGVVLRAPCGYKVIFHHFSEGEDVFPTNDVLAFRYDGRSEGPLCPITDEGEPPDDATWALVRPDGTVIDWDRSYESVAAFQAATRRVAGVP